MEERNPRKMILLAAAVAVVVLLVAGLMFFSASGGSGAKKSAVSKELSVWVVGLDTQALDSVVAGFKAAYKADAATVVTVKKFADYAQYERILPRAIADGNSPDIVTVANDGGWNTLGRYVERLPASVVDPAQFRKDYPQFLVDDLLSEDAVDAAAGAGATGTGKSKTPAEKAVRLVSTLRGVPLGYETLAVFFNSRKMTGVPDAWSGFPSMVQGGGTAASSSDPFGSGSSASGFSPLGIGLGTYVPGSADVFALLLAQQGVRGPVALASATRVLDAYQAFANSPENGLAQFVPEMRASGLTVLDLFLRGKVGAVVGFPSLYREMEYAAKRAGTGEAKIVLRSIRAAAVPQGLAASAVPADADSGSVAAKAKAVVSVNLVRYRYLAVSKFSQHADVAGDFMAYLASKDGQTAVAKAFPWMVPAHRQVAQDQLQAPIAPDWKITKEPFVTADADLVSFDKANPVAWDARLPYVLDLNEADPRQLLSSFAAYLKCVADQDAGTGYDVACLPTGR